MFGVSRTGIRFVLTNFEPGRESDAGGWYDGYTSRILFPGLLVNAYRFENTDAASTDDDPRFAAIYDFVADDLHGAWHATDHHERYPHDAFDDPRWTLVSVPVRSTYALDAERGTPAPDLTAVTLLRSYGAYGPAREKWTAEALASGLYSSASRYGLVDGLPAPERSLEILETTDPDPSTVFARVVDQVGPVPFVEAPVLSGTFGLLSYATIQD